MQNLQRAITRHDQVKDYEYKATYGARAASTRLVAVENQQNGQEQSDLLSSKMHWLQNWLIGFEKQYFYVSKEYKESIGRQISLAHQFGIGKNRSIDVTTTWGSKTLNGLEAWLESVKSAFEVLGLINWTLGSLKEIFGQNKM